MGVVVPSMSSSTTFTRRRRFTNGRSARRVCSSQRKPRHSVAIFALSALEPKT